MRISELDLYKIEWLELVFANRNKQYGAYQLRRDNNNVINRALGMVLAFAVCSSAIITYASHHRPAKPEPTLYEVVNVETLKEQPVIERPKKVDAPKEMPKQTDPVKAQPQQAPSNIKQQDYRSMVAAPDAKAEEVKPLEQGVAVGSREVAGDVNALNVPADEGGGKTGSPDGTGVTDNRPFDAVEVMPQPAGGDAAWAKFLQKNLRYPAVARENEKSGRVFVSFIVERDGRLSDIAVLRKAGFGFDEEALRVLKLAPAWKPGVQNGAAVRVRFTIPINFQLATE